MPRPTSTSALPLDWAKAWQCSENDCTPKSTTGRSSQSPKWVLKIESYRLLLESLIFLASQYATNASRSVGKAAGTALLGVR